MKKEINKLVRDNIPQIIAETCKSLMVVHLRDDQKYLWELKQKLLEEANEVLEATDEEMMINELADCYEVLEAIMNACEIPVEKVMKFKEEKANKNGKFEKKYYLVSVDDGKDDE